ncbi:LPS assembly lipoprotein LptE [Entomobacter blattae]|uniref:LPS-assembly lipoprotein LptE n=1 Tax=Entomobacter blattae TaxID=2762277 RepID=A0A7H1NQP6_9PROT|nr:LPS assembly lipoprotein LptE [Entomobacter blattae]QNT78106.1 hypothetical protein JGUZn3_08740 [Entomobacter blattae]
MPFFRIFQKSSPVLQGALSGSFLLFSLSACGFQPLYNGQKQHEVSAKLRDVYVSSIPERFGQQVRLSLQQNLAGSGPEDPHGYTLNVYPGISSEAIGINQDNTSGRTRSIGTARWELLTISNNPVKLAEGNATTIDGYTVTYEQNIAQTLNDETVKGRIAKNLADEITQQLATWFNLHETDLAKQEADAIKAKEKATAANQIETTNKPERPRYLISGMVPEGGSGSAYQEAGPDGLPAMATGRTSYNPLDTSAINQLHNSEDIGTPSSSTTP